VAGYGGRVELHGRTMRQHTARGTIVNGSYLVLLNGLGLLKMFVVAAFVAPADYGVFAVLGVALGTLMFLKQVGVGDKYIQQDEPDQELAFQKAFTLELLFTGAFFLLILGCVPLFALVYGESKLLAPGLALAFIIPAGVLRAPLWVYYRKMDFVRQRTLQAIDPVVGFVVTVALAVAGAGYWSLVIGLLAGGYSAALAAVLASPYRLRLRYERGTLRSYASFSWPLFIGSASAMVMAQTTALVGEWQLGLAGIGAMALAARLQQWANAADGVVTGTMYPAICAVKDRTDLLFESFVKSNRLALMWGVPFGVAVSLFAGDLVTYVLGDRWQSAVGLFQAFGVVAAITHIGFNWDAFFRARGDTRPVAIVALVTLAAFLCITLPLLVTGGLRGYAFGMAALGLVSLLARGWYLTRLFSALSMARHAARAIAPTIPAVLAVLLARAAIGGERTLSLAVAELVLYVLVTAAATVLLERPLLREVAGYLRRAAPTPAT
jgi:O-antigen/teichoic acid export membrane protein